MGEEDLMPTTRTVRDRHRYWCPTFWKPWRTCVRDTTKTIWCYEFAWRHENAFGFVATEEGCENGKLYSWLAPCFFVFGSSYGPGGEMCFDSPRDHQGNCSPTLGASSSGLTTQKKRVYSRVVVLAVLAVALRLAIRRRAQTTNVRPPRCEGASLLPRRTELTHDEPAATPGL